jgi:glucose-6-phosphate dehydrogenase assembly protein OpcA
VNPAADPLGRLATRRITDAAAAEDPVGSIGERAKTYAPGDTDLAWTRITPWRSMLAAALDQKHGTIERAAVDGEAYNPSAELLALWLADRLGVPVERKVTNGPGLTAVRLFTSEGDICLDRPEGGLAELAVPGQPDRHVALKRRETYELISEELRRLDPDDIYRATVKFGVNHLLNSNGSKDSKDSKDSNGSAGAAGSEGATGSDTAKATPAKKASPASGSGKAAAQK